MAEPKQDLLAGCNDQGVPLADFKALFCDRCRNPTCVRAGWSADKFSRRVAEQPGRLFNPLVQDPELPRYAHIVQTDFPDLLEQAMRLEIAASRNDWNVPEIPILDGKTERASQAQARATLDAARRLRGVAPAISSHSTDDDDPFMIVDDHELPDGQSADPIEETATDTLTPSDMIVDHVRDRAAREVLHGPLPVAQNVPEPDGPGLFLGGGSEPATETPSKDPWAVPAPKPQTVAPGSTFRMGGGK